MPSPDQREFAALLLRKAEGDVEVVRALVDNASITDDAIGFHAQQAIEKAMKAVLAIHGVQFPRTHDLGFLLELADRDGVRIPDVVVEARWLTPWSAEFRYDDPPVPRRPGSPREPAQRRAGAYLGSWRARRRRLGGRRSPLAGRFGGR